MDLSVDTSNVSPPELRKFGLLFGGIIIALFGLALPLIVGGVAAIAPTGKAFTLGAVFIAWALVHPRSLKPVYQLWMKFGAVAGYINTHIIMFLLFALIIAPIGLIMRLLGRDPMHRKLGDASSSYRVLHRRESKSHMEKPF